MIDENAISERFEMVAPHLSELGRRIWAAAEAQTHGRGGLAAVHRATGISRSTIQRGLCDIDSGDADGLAAVGRTRRQGAGRKRLSESQPGLVEALGRLVDPETRGDPTSPLRWTSKSTEKLAAGLRMLGFSVSADTVGRLLRAQHFSLQSNRKRLEGAMHPDRDGQFRRIAELASAAIVRSEPVESVDTKKKELVGNFATRGREWEPSKTPVEVKSHDFPTADGKAVPYGVYDVASNEGFVSVGITADTAEFSVATIRTWWNRLGRERYPDAQEILVTADCGGSNGHRTRLWKLELQQFCDETGLRVRVAHFPPGTSKWNKIEHRMFSQITGNWRGRPLTTFQVIVELIAATTTTTGLKVHAILDTKTYEAGRKVTNAEMNALSISRDEFHGEWNETGSR